MINVYYERTEIDEEITREIVAEEDDLEQLGEWHEKLRTTESELASMIASVRLADEGASLGMARKLGYVRIGLNWVTKRIIELDGEVPDDSRETAKAKRLKHHLTMANQQLEKRNKQVKELRARVQELEMQVRAPA